VVLGLGPGGTERLVVELVTRLQPSVPMAVCCLDTAGAWGEELQSSGVPLTALERTDGFHPLLGGKVARAAARHRASVIHCHHYSPFVYSCLARLWRPTLKIVFTEHGRLSDAPPSAKRRVANQLLSRVPHQVFTVSRDLKQHIVAEGFPERRVAVLYNGIDVGPLPAPDTRRRVRRHLGVGDDMVLVGTIARLDPVKDLHVLVKATAILSSHVPATLLVIGDGDERRRLEMTAAATGRGHAVRFLGHRDDARELLAGCDLYANSSISEGVSLTILEAMAAGIPVVATRVGGTPEVIDDTCARLVPPRDPEAMAAALLELSSAAALAATLARAARARVEARFTLDRMVREYGDAYVRAAGPA
jgi:glycosyltransferase involved in cell wall biosynthesis